MNDVERDRKNILLIEDDFGIARSLQVNLQLEGFHLLWASSLYEGHLISEKEILDLIILDINLPDGNGLHFLEKLRLSGIRLPVIILTAVLSEYCATEAFRHGANDFMKKPFSSNQLIARIKAALNQPPVSEEKICYGDLLLLLKKKSVKFKEQNINLDRREFNILLHLIQRAETIVTRESLLQIIFKDGEIFDRTLDSHVNDIQSRLRESGVTTVRISRVYGVGYRVEKAS
jgi:DNA-binding response OmpR family regulator